MWVVGGAAARRARGRASSKDAVAYLAVALAPAAVVFRNRCAAAHVCATWMLFGSARARGRGFSLRDGCPLMSAACYSPRLLLRASLRGGARTHKGQPRLGAKHSGWFPTSAAATLCWGEVLWLLPRLERALTAPLVAYRTLANRFAGCMTSNAAIGYDRLPEVAWHRIVAATVAGLHLEAKLLHSGSVNLHSVALFASNPQYKLVWLG